jgi:hypothetical protein
MAPHTPRLALVAALAIALPATAAQVPPAKPAPSAPSTAGNPGTSSFGAPTKAGDAPEPEPQAPKPSARPEEKPDPKVAANATRLPAVLPTGCSVWPNDPALLKLEAEREALEMVDHAARLGSEEAGRRVAAMHAFIDQRDIESRWARFSRSYVPTLDQLTFAEAVARAKSHAAGTVAKPQTNDIDHLEGAVEVESGVALASWNHLNRLRRMVDILTAFLMQENLLEQYRGWAPQYMHDMGWNPPRPAPGQAPSDEAVRRRGLQLEWDRAQREQRAQQPLVAAGNAPPAGSTPDAPPQYGTVPAPVAIGASPARSIYSNSWWNSYADPYYDTSGLPSRNPNLDPARANDPKTYGNAPEAYSYRAWPTYWDLGPNVYPAYGMFPGGMVGGTGMGAAAGGSR